MMSSETYADILETIRAAPLLRQCQQLLIKKYPSILDLTLSSILSNFVQKKMKRIHGSHNNSRKIEEYYKLYKQAVENKEEPGIILRLADSIELCPVLTARLILEAYHKEIDTLNNQVLMNGKDGGAVEPILNGSFNRSEVGRLLRYTEDIDDPNLAYEVYLCTVQDDQYGPFPDAIKQSIGAEYEQLLKSKLTALNICFVDESILRQQGYDKTPDFKLEIPIAVGNQVITWIECKARFGDEEVHKTYLDEQLLSYWNRYGPGMVIYWFGYVDTLKTTPGILIRHDFPSNSEIVFFNPNPAPSSKSDVPSTNAVRAITFT